MSANKLSSEVATQMDLSVIRYSRVLEDHRVLSEALSIAPNQDIVLSVASAGDNVLNLLLEQPKKIAAIDISVAQTSLLELKLAAITSLTHQEFLILLGEVEATGDERMALLMRVKQHLPTQALAFWEGHSDAIREGLATSGRFITYMHKTFRDIMTEAEAQILDDLFNAPSLEEQKRIFQLLPIDKFEASIRNKSKKSNLVKARSEAQQKYLQDHSDESIADMLWAQFNHVCLEVSLRDNFYHSWMTRGERGYDPVTLPEFAPPYLRAENYQALKGLVDRVEVHTLSLEQYLAIPEIPSFNKGNFTNLFEYKSETDTEKLFDVIADKLAPGGCIAYWEYALQRMPKSCTSLKYLRELSMELHRRDRLFFYSAMRVYKKA